MARSNTWGTEFIVYDKGMNPTKIDSAKSMSYSGRMPSGNPDQIRKELCAVTYVSIAFTRVERCCYLSTGTTFTI